jgi:hypothetical protein
VRVVEAFVDRESILSALEEASTPTEPDLLVIDVDGNDYWIRESVASRYLPRVVVIEYNPTVGPHLQWVMPYNPNHQWNNTAWHGAGLAALARLGRRLGYELVGCDSHGVNEFIAEVQGRTVSCPTSGFGWSTTSSTRPASLSSSRSE